MWSGIWTCYNYKYACKRKHSVNSINLEKKKVFIKLVLSGRFDESLTHNGMCVVIKLLKCNILYKSELTLTFSLYLCLWNNVYKMISSFRIVSQFSKNFEKFVLELSENIIIVFRITYIVVWLIDCFIY